VYGRAAKMKPQDILAKAYEEEEEDIKIFESGEDEPKSLMEIKHSLVVKYANYSLQMFRLYVVYEGEDRDGVIAKLREAVKGWHEA
jgi:hypothetical protein